MLAATMMASSSYVAALPPELVDPGETLLPPPVTVAPVPAPAPAPAAAPTTGRAESFGFADTGLAPAVTSRRGLYLALGGLLVLAMVVVAIAVALGKKNHAQAPPADAGVRVASSTADAGIAPDDAGAAALGPTDAPRAVDAAASVVRPTNRISPAAEHLRAAEDALKQNNRLRQLAEADLALQADPRNVRAKYLLADALIKGGDLDRGCAYLRQLGRNPLALARASVANCPP
jgi:hypothetical protein